MKGYFSFLLWPRNLIKTGKRIRQLSYSSFGDFETIALISLAKVSPDGLPQLGDKKRK